VPAAPGASSTNDEGSADQHQQHQEQPYPPWDEEFADEEWQQTYLSLLVEDLTWSLGELGCWDDGPRVSGGGDGAASDAAEATGDDCSDGGDGRRDDRMRTVERLAVSVHEALTVHTGRYHDLMHAFEISAGASPIQLLAAIFRDVAGAFVAIDVGRGIEGDGEGGDDDPVDVQHLIRDALLRDDVEEGDQPASEEATRRAKLILNPALAARPVDLLVCRVFGNEPGQDVPAPPDRSRRSAGSRRLEVFLSALCAARSLQDVLPLRCVAQLAACLEATVPLRREQHEMDKAELQQQQQTMASPRFSSSPTEDLFEALQRCNVEFGLGLEESELVATVQMGADLHNRCLGNMVSDDLAFFLSHTWRLLPEQQDSLASGTMHTLPEYYAAVAAVLDAVQRIEPRGVYLSFRGLPAPSDVDRYHRQLERNLSRGLPYLRARFLAVAVVSAFDRLTRLGGDFDGAPSDDNDGDGFDAPTSYFFGDLSRLNVDSRRLGEQLVAPLRSARLSPIGSGSSLHDDVLAALLGRGMWDSNFDSRDASLAAYLYAELCDSEDGGDDARARHTTEELCEVPATVASSRALLRWLPRYVVEAVAKELRWFLVSREVEIDRVLADLHMLEAVVPP
jgi:hypothetical protein